MRASCWIAWARFRQVSTARYSLADSASQATTVMTTRIVSWSNRSSTPKRRPTKLDSALTTTSTAAPISSSGAMSNALFTTDMTMAKIARLRWRLA
jgi:hypothetical protein